LKDRDLVEHKATYWAITDDAEGTEDKEAWREYAPGEPHPSVEDEQ